MNTVIKRLLSRRTCVLGSSRAPFFAVMSIALVALYQAPVRADSAIASGDVVRGQLVYSTQCAACHGAALEGQPAWREFKADGSLPAPPHDESGHTWHHDDQYLFDYVALGGAGLLARRGITGFVSAMPAFSPALTAEDIWNVLAYIRSTWSDEIKAMQSSRNP